MDFELKEITDVEKFYDMELFGYEIDKLASCNCFDKNSEIAYAGEGHFENGHMYGGCNYMPKSVNECVSWCRLQSNRVYSVKYYVSCKCDYWGVYHAYWHPFTLCGDSSCTLFSHCASNFRAFTYTEL